MYMITDSQGRKITALSHKARANFIGVDDILYRACNGYSIVWMIEDTK